MTDLERENRACAVLPDDSPARCRACGYALRGLTEPRCPECGRAFDPADSRTVYLGRVPGWFARLLLRPPGWPLQSCLTLLALLALFSVSTPGGYFLVDLLAYFGLAVLGFVWLMRLVLAIAAAVYYRHALARAWRWALVPVAIAVVIVLVRARVPLRLRFELSHGALDRLAAGVVSGTVDPNDVVGHWVGTYPVERVERLPGGMRFIVRDTGFLYAGGFAYSPGQAPTVVGEDRYHHIAGPWYEWLECW